ncbi:phosphodiester glycosidase family protein [Catenulispora acidiphila]|nr:phosphodiester glycosidase family protein [Catenulispora acidiphila]
MAAAVAGGVCAYSSPESAPTQALASSTAHRAAVKPAVAPTSPRRTYPLQAPLVVAAARAFPNEGQWRALATDSRGEPVVQGTFLHAAGTSAPVAIAWIKQSAARFELHPGYAQPGGSWSQPDMLPRDRRGGLVATWNGGFLMGDSGGGFYLDGKQHGPLVPGVAAEVFRRDGSFTVGVWGRDVTLGSDVVGVRQQRQLMVDGGRIAGDIDSLFTWGVTDGGATYVRRSGVGVTADGDVVFALGPTMSPRSLATALQRAGAVRAMELDINISWPSFMAYDSSGNPGDPRPFKWGDYPRSAERYFSHSARDFVAVYARATGAQGGACVDPAGVTRSRPGGDTLGGPLAC